MSLGQRPSVSLLQTGTAPNPIPEQVVSKGSICAHAYANYVVFPLFFGFVLPHTPRAPFFGVDELKIIFEKPP